jgi:hypothetical protein
MFTRGYYPKKLVAHESMKSPFSPASAHWSLRPKPTSGAEGVSPGDIPSIMKEWIGFGGKIWPPETFRNFL